MVVRMVNEFCNISIGNSPIIVTSIHNGHNLRFEVADQINIPEIDRLREEDPYTDSWVKISDTNIICNRSRFEVDINRVRGSAVYLTPEDAWGLQVWKQKPSSSLINNSLIEYDKFYQQVEGLLLDKESRFGHFVLLDLHSYNHMRTGANDIPADSNSNPEVNIGTESIENDHWKPLIKHFISDLRSFDYLDRHLDVRENVKFKGGYFPRWVNQHFPETGCAIAVEFKKFFMNEWTGEIYWDKYEAIKTALKSTIPGLLKELTLLKTHDNIRNQRV